MHLKQEIVSEAMNRLASKGTDVSNSNSIQVPVTLIAPNYMFYSYQVVFERSIDEDGVKASWIPTEVIKL